LSFKNTNELNKIIDHELPTGCPKFKWEQVVVAGESFDVYYHDIIECIKSLYGDPDEGLTIQLRVQLITVGSDCLAAMSA
jgi:hypothetical protein